jgi:hypothetical protein
MKWNTTDPQPYLKLVSFIVLLVGLVGATLIYLAADNDLNNVLGYEIVDGKAYPIMPEDSKAYLGNLQHFGGKQLVLIDELNRWFIGLWHGKTLAFTVTFITIVISFVVLFIANHMPSNF